MRKDAIGALVARVKDLDARATPGPWTTKRSPRDGQGWPIDTPVAMVAPKQGVYASPPGGTFPAADQDLIAEYRTLAVQLADAVAALAADAEMAQAFVLKLKRHQEDCGGTAEYVGEGEGRFRVIFAGCTCGFADIARASDAAREAAQPLGGE